MACLRTTKGLLSVKFSKNFHLKYKTEQQQTTRLLLLFSCQAVSNSFVTPWTVAFQAPLSMGFPRQEYCSGLPFPSPGDLPNPGIEPVLLHCRWILLSLSHQGSPPRKVISKRLSLISFPYHFLYLLCSSYHAAYLYFLPYLLH